MSFEVPKIPIITGLITRDGPEVKISRISGKRPEYNIAF